MKVDLKVEVFWYPNVNVFMKNTKALKPDIKWNYHPDDDSVIPRFFSYCTELS